GGGRRAKARLADEPYWVVRLAPPFTRAALQLSREELQDLSKPFINRTAELVDAVLQRNELAPADIAAICLVGGSSRLGMVARVLESRFGLPPLPEGDPQALTAHGSLPQEGKPTTTTSTTPPPSP